MQRYFISEINIKNIYHLSNIKIELNPNECQHLLLTGPNGSGKSSVLKEIKRNLSYFEIEGQRLIESKLLPYKEMQEKRQEMERESWEEYVFCYADKVELLISGKKDDIFCSELCELCDKGEILLAFYDAGRKTTLIKPKGAEQIYFDKKYSMNQYPAQFLLKYMVHLKTQQAYARNEDDVVIVEKIRSWFVHFENALRNLFDDDSVKLVYDYKDYNFKIYQKGHFLFDFTQLSDGYSSVIWIVADLMLRMDRNWFLNGRDAAQDMQGIVLIDELETHLHISLQKKILPFLTEFFPGIQFIITTHSPYILNSISNAKIYDLERKVEYEDFSDYSASGIVEGYFESSEYSERLKKRLLRYSELVNLKTPTKEERAERAELRSHLNGISQEFAPEIYDAFKEIEQRRKIND